MTTHRHPERESTARHLSFQYNPYEIALCDPLGLFGDRFLDSLARELAGQYKVGTVIEKLPSDDLDTTDGVARLYNVAGQSLLSYPRGHYGAPLIQPLIELDLVIIQDEAAGSRPQILVVEDGPPPPEGNVIAYVAERSACPILPPSAPFFTRDDLTGLANHLTQQLRAQADEVPFLGLVLTGHRASRQHAAQQTPLKFREVPQSQYCYELLQKHCQEVFVSAPAGQGRDEELGDLPRIPDVFLGFGPMGAILSAMAARPDAAWLVLACDLPFVETGLLTTLIQGRNPLRLATAFVSANGRPEPLCAVYEPKSVFAFHRSMAQGSYRLHKVLEDSAAQLLPAPNPEALTNVNTQQEYEEAMARLTRHRETAQ